jgi:drug/metabolite transporter (DMT)-like permease
MEVSVVAVVVVACVALAFSGLDVLRKVLGASIEPIPLLVLLTLGSLPIFLAWAASESRWEVAPAYVVPGASSIALNVVANLAFLQAVRVSPLSLTIPYLSLTPVFTTLLAIPILGERPGPLQLVGILLVVAGAFWLSVPADGSISPRSLVRALAGERGSLLMILTALCWSLAVPLDKLAIEASSPALHALIMMSGIAAVGLATLSLERRLGELRAGRWGLIGAAVLATAVGAALSFVALTMFWVGFVETLKRALGSFLALLWGRLLFAEDLTARKLSAVGLMAAGVGLILW